MGNRIYPVFMHDRGTYSNRSRTHTGNLSVEQSVGFFDKNVFLPGCGHINKRWSELHERIDMIVQLLYALTFLGWDHLKGEQGFTLIIFYVLSNFHSLFIRVNWAAATVLLPPEAFLFSAQSLPPAPW